MIIKIGKRIHRYNRGCLENTPQQYVECRLLVDKTGKISGFHFQSTTQLKISPLDLIVQGQGPMFLREFIDM